jgi:hypothetical protein
MEGRNVAFAKKPNKGKGILWRSGACLSPAPQSVLSGPDGGLIDAAVFRAVFLLAVLSRSRIFTLSIQFIGTSH